MDQETNAGTPYPTQGLLGRVRQAADAVAPEPALLTVEQLAPIDQFHTRGLAATVELAEAAGIGPDAVVLDLGSGLGGPARFLAAKHGARVIGIDISGGLVEAATYLSRRCGLSDRTRFTVGDATRPEVADGSCDLVVLLHVAMNIVDRPALYRAVHRALKPGGRFVTYDVVARGPEVLYPAPWAAEAGDSHLLTEAETRTALGEAGFAPLVWTDQTETAAAWFAQLLQAGPPKGPNLATVLGPDFPGKAANLGRNLREGRVGILSAVLAR